MSILESITSFSNAASSGIGNAILEVVKAPFDFTKDIVQIPFDFVGNTVSGLSTKIVLIVGLLIVGVFVVGKFNIIGKLK